MVQIPRLHFPNPLSALSEIIIVEEQHHYLSKVLRCNVGDELSLFNSTCGQWRARITNIDKKSIAVALIKHEAAAKIELGPTLFFAPIKNVTTSFIVQKATELGVSVIQPIKTRYSVIDKVNIEKLRLVAIEATEQCERFSVPQINDIAPLEKAISLPIYQGELLFCNENKTGELFSDYCLRQKPLQAGLVIGPEGGFSDEEVQMLTNVSVDLQLGSRILRSETAIIAALSIYQAMVESSSEQ